MSPLFCYSVDEGDHREVDRGSEGAKALKKAIRLSEEKSYGYSLSRFMKNERWAIGSFMTMAKTHTAGVIKRWQN
jgi:hypothetical protein